MDSKYEIFICDTCRRLFLKLKSSSVFGVKEKKCFKHGKIFYMRGMPSWKNLMMDRHLR